jgi:hypothetical protein
LNQDFVNLNLRREASPGSCARLSSEHLPN